MKQNKDDTGLFEEIISGFHILTKSSPPPLAKYRPFGLQTRPHTS